MGVDDSNCSGLAAMAQLPQQRPAAKALNPQPLLTPRVPGGGLPPETTGIADNDENIQANSELTPSRLT
jgi:hypothetical protein